jgi:cytochrome c6
MLLAITTTGKVVLLVVAGTFIAFSLLVSMVIPRRRPGFPGKDLPAFVVTCVLLFGAQIAAVAWVTGTQEVEAATPETTTTETTTTPPPVTTSTTTTEAGTTTAPAGDPGDATAGKQVFTTAGCVSCHTLKDAGASGTVGPNLDERKPPYSRVVDRVTNGKGVMPSFSGKLSATDIQNVAKYVSTVAGT